MDYNENENLEFKNIEPEKNTADEVVETPLTTDETITTQTNEDFTSEPYRYVYQHGEKVETTVSDTPYEPLSHTVFEPQQNTPDFTAESSSAPKKKNKKKFPKFLKWMAGAACFGIIAGAAFLGTAYFGENVLGINYFPSDSENTNNRYHSGNSVNATPVNVTLGTASTIEAAEGPSDSVVVQVVDQNLAATVAVRSTYTTTSYYFGQYYESEAQSSGSGFIVGINDTELLIATNNHVIDSANKIEITFIDDVILEAYVKGTDSIADLAIIAVPLNTISADTLSVIRVATLGDSDNVLLGEMCIAIGNALGYGQSVTVGYISAKDREVTVDGNKMVLLQTDAAINGGNSGGPLFNTKGEVIGINSVKYADTDVEGMCFAIPISRAIPILNELMNRETLAEEDRGFLGVSSNTVTENVSSYYGWPIGAYIVSVLEDSPAEDAGIYIGDIVTGVNGVQITTADQLVAAISSYRHGTTVDITLQRNVNGRYEELTLSVTLAQRSDFETEDDGLIEEDSSESKRPRK